MARQKDWMLISVSYVLQSPVNKTGRSLEHTGDQCKCAIAVWHDKCQDGELQHAMSAKEG